MKELLRKDLPWAVPMLVAGASTVVSILAMRGTTNLWVLPVAREEELYVASAILGAVLGLVAMLFEPLSGTQEFLRHRPISPHRLHAGRVVSCAVLLAGWALLPVLSWLWACATTPVSLASVDAIIDVWAFQVVGCTTCAITLFTFSLPMSWLDRALSTAVLGVVVWPWIYLTSESTDGHQTLGWWYALHTLTTCTLVAGSFANTARFADRDRPWPERLRRRSGATLVVGLTMAIAFGLAHLQQGFIRELHYQYPTIESSDSAIRLTRTERGDDGRNHVYQVDADHERISGAEIGLDHGESGRSFRPQPSNDDFGFDSPRLTRLQHLYGYSTPGHKAVLDKTTGLVTVAWRNPRSLEVTTIQTVGRGAENRPFGKDAQLLLRHASAHISIWIETDAALWRLERGSEGGFVEMHLPDGGELVAAVRLRESDTTATDDRFDWLREHVMVAVSSRGTCFLVGDSIEPAPEELAAAARPRAANQSKPALSIDAEQTDLLRWEVEVSRDSEVVFSHTYTPRTTAERAYAGLAIATSALRAPALQFVSYLTNETHARSPGQQPLLDPLCVGGRRPWLPWLALTIAAITAVGVRRALTRRGVPPTRVRAWTAWTICFGPATAVLAFGLETKRAHASRKMPEPPPPRIRSKAEPSAAAATPAAAIDA